MHLLLFIDLGDWTTWIAPLIGLVATVLAYWLGVKLTERRQRQRLPARPTTPPADPMEDPFVHGGKLERRTSVRRRGNAVAILVSDANARAEPISGWVVDRSMGGLCLCLSESFSPGTLLSVRAANAPSAVPWVQVEVKSCRQSNRDWEVGCKFLRTPPWSTLLLFG